MRGTIAKQIRRLAERDTVGKPEEVTRRYYRYLKKQYMNNK